MVALAPYLAGIVIVIGRTLLIHLLESSLRRLALDDVITAGLNTLYAVLNRAMDEEIERIKKWVTDRNLFLIINKRRQKIMTK